jgi:hypothetical protein
MARFGGLFHLCRSISRPIKKNIISTMSYVDSDVDHQRGCQKFHGNWHRAAQKMMPETQSVLIAAP